MGTQAPCGVTDHRTCGDERKDASLVVEDPLGNQGVIVTKEVLTGGFAPCALCASFFKRWPVDRFLFLTLRRVVTAGLSCCLHDLIQSAGSRPPWHFVLWRNVSSLLGQSVSACQQAASVPLLAEPSCGLCSLVSNGLAIDSSNHCTECEVLLNAANHIRALLQHSLPLWRGCLHGTRPCAQTAP